MLAKAKIIGESLPLAGTSSLPWTLRNLNISEYLCPTLTKTSGKNQHCNIVFQRNNAKFSFRALRHQRMDALDNSSPTPARATVFGASISRTMTPELSRLRFGRDSTF